MRVDEKICFAKYLRDARFRGRDGLYEIRQQQYMHVDLDRRFLYFGRDAISVSRDTRSWLVRSSDYKRGPGFRKDVSKNSSANLPAGFV